MKKRVFFSNCEGSISKNNNALELTKHFVPEGDRVYDIINKYCYVNDNFSKKKDSRIAQTSKLVLPFLLAFDASNKSAEQFSAANLALFNNCKESLSYLKGISDLFIFSTGYEHHARAICRETGIPLENFYCTRVNLDKYSLSDKEKAKLKSLAWEIGGMPSLQIPPNAKTLKDLSDKDQAAIKRLDKIFWNEVSKTNCKQLFYEVAVVGQTEKMSAITSKLNSLSATIDDVMYVGNDLSDVEPMKLIHNNGGFAVSFAGDIDTIRNANVAVLSTDYAPIGVLADLFLRFGQIEASRVAGNFDKDVLWLTAAEPNLLNRLLKLEHKNWPKVRIISEWNVEEIVNQVDKFRKTARE